MSARISIDLDETPDATIDVTTGADHSNVWVKLRGKAQPTGEQERYEVRDTAIRKGIPKSALKVRVS